MSAKTPVIIIAGVGNGTGTGGFTAREFSKLGYKVGLIAKNKDNLQSLADELKASGGQASFFAVQKYGFDEMEAAWAFFRREFAADAVRAALWNVTEGVRKPFLEMQRHDIQRVSDADVVAGFAFAQEAVRTFLLNEPNEHGKRGFLVFTSATGAKRGAPNSTVTATGKFAIRGLSQSIAKEFKERDIHVSHAIIDAMILTERWKVMFGEEWYSEKTKDETHRVHPVSIAKAYIYLAQQDRSAWTWELDLRPSHETWTW